jgi:hypothetical protein
MIRQSVMSLFQYLHSCGGYCQNDLPGARQAKKNFSRTGEEEMTLQAVDRPVSLLFIQGLPRSGNFFANGSKERCIPG